jgi:hypothetical protein
MDNEDLAELDPLARLLFIYLWMLADREGRLEDRPKRIAAMALPYDRDADVDALLNQLAEAKFILRYTAQDKACIQILTFIEHQRPHPNETPSDLPPVEGQRPVEARRNSPVDGDCLGMEDEEPPWSEALHTKVGSTLPCSSDCLNVDSLNADCLRSAGTGKPSRRKRLAIDVLPVEWERYCQDKHAQRDAACEFEKFADYHRSKGNAMADWPAAWRTWLRNADAYASRGQPRGPPQQPTQGKYSATIAGLTGRTRQQEPIDVTVREIPPRRLAGPTF